jgi:protein gp37
MALHSEIQWTESTWNPVTGCTKISTGCKNCYAERMALRLQAANNPSYINGFRLTMHERMVYLPLKWNKPQKIFVNSMSDLFHPEVSIQFILNIFEIMNKAYWHRFQILTKRSERIIQLNNELPWASNIWMGVSVEDSDNIIRIKHLKTSNARIKFLSLEPLLGPLSNLDLSGIDWVIVGGESGPNARPVKEAWIMDIRDQCLDAKVPFFFKQWGGINKKKAGRELEGRTWDEMPMDLSYHTYPLANLFQGSRFG